MVAPSRSAQVDSVHSAAIDLITAAASKHERAWQAGLFESVHPGGSSVVEQEIQSQLEDDVLDESYEEDEPVSLLPDELSKLELP